MAEIPHFPSEESLAHAKAQVAGDHEMALEEVGHFLESLLQLIRELEPRESIATKITFPPGFLHGSVLIPDYGFRVPIEHNHHRVGTDFKNRVAHLRVCGELHPGGGENAIAVL